MPSPVDWRRVTSLLQVSRALDELELQRLVPQGMVDHLFPAGGHDLAQILLGTLLTHSHDGVGAYYRSRPLMLALGVSPEQALTASLNRRGGYSDGRDGGPACNFESPDRATVMPMVGDVGGQYTPAAGWAEAIHYRRTALGERSYDGAIAVVCGGDGSVATNGFWAALNTACALGLPLFFYIEDNGLSMSVPSELQCPGGNIAANLSSFANLSLADGDGTDPEPASRLLADAVNHVRGGIGPALLRLSVPRLAGHAAHDSPDGIGAGTPRDPLTRLRRYLVPTPLSEQDWADLEQGARSEVAAALERALTQPDPDPSTVQRYVFSERAQAEPAQPRTEGLADPGERGRRTLRAAIRDTLRSELANDPRVRVFGQDVGARGGIYGATTGLQQQFGSDRVFDTNLSEEGIVGRAIGMALAGLRPVAEIQFRKYADAATLQLCNGGTIRWRTANRCAAPVVVRMPVGSARVNDPWHSVSAEAEWVHRIGWRVAFPSNAEDAVGLLRTAMRGDDPTLFFEHRALLLAGSASGDYPGDDYMLPFGRARTVRSGSDLTVVTWGAMVERCVQAAGAAEGSVEILDLRTLQPWDRSGVLESVSRTHRCLIVHGGYEDRRLRRRGGRHAGGRGLCLP